MNPYAFSGGIRECMPEATTTDGEPKREALTSSPRLPADANRSLRWGAYLIALAGIGFIVNALGMLYRVFFDPGFEAGVDALGGVTRADLAATNHAVVHYIDHLHVNVAGLMVAAGLAMIALAWYGVRRGQRWAWVTAIMIPVVFLAHSLPIHQTAGFSFDALTHLGPGLVWLPALIVGAGLAYHGLQASDSSAGKQDGSDRYE